MKFIVTLEALSRRYDWDKACKALNLSNGCLKEGTANKDDEVTLTKEQAIHIGMLTDETMECDACGSRMVKKDSQSYATWECPECKTICTTAILGEG